jgi:hypothetical protein
MRVTCPSLVRMVITSDIFINRNIVVNYWPTPSNDGSFEVNIEYELENDKLSLYDLLISVPLP